MKLTVKIETGNDKDMALTLIDKFRPVRISGAQEFPCPECGCDGSRTPLEDQ